VPTKDAPADVIDQYELAVGAVERPTAKQMLARPITEPSNILFAYEKV
jgi:hypothetical protein